MKMRTACVLVVVALGVSVGRADTSLSRAEIVSILDQLVRSPRTAWIACGTVTALHTEYRYARTTDQAEVRARVQEALSAHKGDPGQIVKTEDLQKDLLDALEFNVEYEWLNEHTMVTQEVIKTDGSRYYWDTDIRSYTETMAVPASLANNPMSDHFRQEWNGRRIYAWDGQQYTSYNLPVNAAMVDASGLVPQAFNGPLTAGLVSWGMGYLSRDRLMAAQAQAKSKDLGGSKVVWLYLDLGAGISVETVLDPANGYAMQSFSQAGPGDRKTTIAYSGQVSGVGSWIPTGIQVDQYDLAQQRLLQRDVYQIESVSTKVPPASAFRVSFQAGATVEHRSPLSAATQIYQNCPGLDPAGLLAERLNVAAAEQYGPQSCGAVALRHAALALGRPIPESHLSGLAVVNSKASLYSLKDLAQRQGLYCQAVRTDLSSLSRLSGCQVILHIPGQDHYVVLGGVNQAEAWIIDLTSRHFLRPIPAQTYAAMEWTGGVALLISTKPITLAPGMSVIQPEATKQIMGGGYTCTKLAQNESYVPCNLACTGYFYIFSRRVVCESAPEGICVNQLMERYRKSPCQWVGSDCTISGTWWVYYMWACE